MPPPELHRATLANGLRVLVVPDPATPVVGVAVHVDVGFRSEPEGRTGFAHLFEHLMFQGSESLEKLAHFRHVQSSGGVFNGSTHQDYTDYFEVLPAAALERALFLEADRLRAPTLTDQNLRNQIDVVKEEIRLNVLNRPYGGFPWILLPPVLYATFPNAHNGYGDFSELEQASLDDAAAFFDTYYAPGNAQVTVAGYLDVDEALSLVEKHGQGLKTLKALYIDCGDTDQFNLVYGSRRMHRRLTALGVPHIYEEFADDHTAVDYRMDVSLPILAKALVA